MAGFRVRLILRASRRLLVWGAAALLLPVLAAELASESVTLSAYYPAPSGVYTQLIATQAAVLARDDGRVGVGASAPQEKLDVSGSVKVSQDVLVRGQSVVTQAVCAAPISCVKTGNTVTIRKNSCSSAGQACSSSGQCCGGAACSGGVCAAPACYGPGECCVGDSSCCSGRCTSQCFAGETRVLTPGGYVPIMRLAAGDLVLSMDLSARRLVPKAILAAHRRTARTILRVGLANGLAILVTPEHPFFDPVAGAYRSIGDFRPGDSVALAKNGGADVEAVRIAGEETLTPGELPVFNITVEGPHHNYVVDGVIVHNKEFCPGTCIEVQ